MTMFKKIGIFGNNLQKSQFCYWELGILEFCWAAATKLRTATDKLELTDWSQVNWMFGSGEIAIFRQRSMIAPPLLPIRVKRKEI